MEGEVILVTGGAGFLGSAVCRTARAAGARVHAVHRRAVADIPNADLLVEHWQADLTDRAAVGALLERVRPHIIIHAAGYANASREEAQVEPALRNNLLATVNVLSAANAVKPVRVVLTGSVEAPTCDDIHTEVTPNSPYAASKFAEACYARMYHRLYGLDVVIARLVVVYGPEEHRPAKLLPYVASRLKAGEPAELASGQRKIDWLYIDDAAQGLLACAMAKDVAGQTLDIGTGRLTSVANAAGELARLLGRPDLLKLGAKPDRPDELEVAADVATTERKIGWRPRIRLEDGLATIASFMATLG